MDYYQTLVESRLEPMGVSGDNHIYRCPVCENHKGSGHLYVNYNKGKFHCFKCDLKGKFISSLLKILGYDIDNLRDVPVHLYQKSTIQDQLEEVMNLRKSVDTETVEYSHSLSSITEYYLQSTVELSPRARQYLNNKRGVTDSMISFYQMREGVNNHNVLMKVGREEVRGSDYSGRVMIPSICGEQVSFFVARDYLDRSDTIKYRNPPQTIAYASEDVWNLHNILTPTVIICEGVLTAISAGRWKNNAVATYGKSIAEKSSSEKNVTSQGEKLLSRKFDRYIVAYDADAFKETIESCEYLYARGANVYYLRVPPVKGPKTDIADLSDDLYLDVLRNMKKYDPNDRLLLYI